MDNRKHKNKAKNLPPDRIHSGLPTGLVLIVMGLILLPLGGTITAYVFIFIGVIIILDYFLLEIFLKQTSHHKIRKR